MLTIPEAADAQAVTAAKKAASITRPVAYLVQAMLAGSFIGIAVVLMCTAAGPLEAVASPWAPLVKGLVFGVALTLVVAAGGELATSNMMTLPQGVLMRSIGWRRGAGTLAFSFVGNLAGAAVFAAIVVGSGVLAPTTAAGKMLGSMLEHKAAETAGQLFWRGVLCNMLVCLAIWAAARLTSEGAKLAVIFWCLLAFITSGYEHVIANMTSFMVGLISGMPQTSWAEFGRNLFFVGTGNLVGGALLVGLAFTVAAGRTNLSRMAPPAPVASAPGPAVATPEEPAVLTAP